SARPLGRQDHTISPSASLPLVNSHKSVHRLPASRLVTTANRPSATKGGMAGGWFGFTEIASEAGCGGLSRIANRLDLTREIGIRARGSKSGGQPDCSI